MAPSAAPRHATSLANELIAGDLPRPKHRKRKSLHDEDEAEQKVHGYVDAKASRKILKLGQDLAEEEEEARRSTSHSAAQREGVAGFRNLDFEHFPDDDEEAEQEDPSKWDDDDAWADDEDVEEVEVDPEDRDIFDKFVPNGEEPTFDLDGLRRAQAQAGEVNQGQGTDLADLILQRIAEKEAADGAKARGEPVSIQGGGAPEDAVEIPMQVVDVYTKIGQILSRYKSGKLPKPLKIVHTLPHWEELLSITRPENWTPNAMEAFTKIIMSARPPAVRFFLQEILLAAVRDRINEEKKLNVHLYKALQKATYKPAGFFKGIVFPLIESETCTLREAHIVSSIVTRASIPPLHAGAAMLRLTDIAAEQASNLGTENSGATNIFLRAFIEKGYALPYKVVDNLVFHFLRFRAITNNVKGDDAMTGVASQGIEGKLPVLWHQCLLAFAQRYRNDITEDQREALLDLLQERGHRDIGPEVRRELLAGRGRGVVALEERKDFAGDDTMEMDAA